LTVHYWLRSPYQLHDGCWPRLVCTLRKIGCFIISK
jgi:hypothetical protein